MSENLNLEQFRNILKQETKKIFTSICKNKNICGFSLYSDGDASSISAAYNTFNHLTENWNNDQGEDQEYYKWYPAEWKEEGVESEILDGISKMLFEISTSDQMEEEKAFINFRSSIYSSIVQVLKELKEEKLFEPMNDHFVLVFNVNDYSDLENELKWIKELNKEELYTEYRKWTERW